MTDLRQRFEDLTAESLQKFIDLGQEENLHLEFKTVGGADFKNPQDRRNLARTMSAFANSDGGIIVWGVVACKADGEPDCASSLQPVAGVAALLPRLNELTSDFLSPVHDGVHHRILHELPDGSGYAATLVLPSDAGPHMAKGGVDQYFKRSGDSTVRMEHFDIADMFGRRPKPSLQFSMSVVPDGALRSGANTFWNFKAVGVIQNLGRGSALAPYLSITVQKPFRVSDFGVDGNGSHGLANLVKSGDVRRFGASATVMLHPHTSLEVFAIRDRFDMESPSLPDLQVDYELSAADMPLQTGSLILTQADIIKPFESLPSPF